MSFNERIQKVGSYLDATYGHASYDSEDSVSAQHPNLDRDDLISEVGEIWNREGYFRSLDLPIDSPMIVNEGEKHTLFMNVQGLEEIVVIGFNEGTQGTVASVEVYDRETYEA